MLPEKDIIAYELTRGDDNMQMVHIKSNAKVNLSLDVTGRRNDGYHNIESVMQSIDLSDEIIIRNSGKPFELSI